MVTNAMGHKPHALMSAPVFVYQLEISGHLFTLVTSHFFPIRRLSLFKCGLVLLACLEHVHVLSLVKT